MKRVVQLVPSHHARDATGAEARYLDQLFRNMGWQSEIYADQWDDELADITQHWKELTVDDPRNTVAVFHFAVHSPISEYFADLNCKRVMIFHNVTPAVFFEPYDTGLAEVCRRSREEMKYLAEHTDLAIAHSNYSQRELIEAGYPVTRVIPFMLDEQRTAEKADPAMLKRLSDRPNVLFVGRLVPNKAPDDFIRVAQAFHRSGYCDARFLLVGKRPNMPAFTDMIDELVADTGLNHDQLLLTGEVSDAELMACYQSS